MFRCSNREVYSETCQVSSIEHFAEIVNSRFLDIFAKSTILDIWQGSEYTSLLLPLNMRLTAMLIYLTF